VLEYELIWLDENLLLSDVTCLRKKVMLRKEVVRGGSLDRKRSGGSNL